MFLFLLARLASDLWPGFFKKNDQKKFLGVFQGHPVMVQLSLNLGTLQNEIGNCPG